MENLLYVLAILLIMGWVIGFFGFGAGIYIHLLLITAIFAIVFRIIKWKTII